MKSLLLTLVLSLSISGLALGQETLTLQRALYFSNSGSAPDGNPWARFDEHWGIRFNSPDPRWAFSSKPSILIGYVPDGTNWGNDNLLVLGKIGIGTNSPVEKLDIHGNLRFESPGQGIHWNSITQSKITEGWGIEIHGDSNHPLQVLSTSLLVGFDQNDATLRGSGNMLVSGSVGIGTTSPERPLHVDGLVLSGGSNAGFVFRDRNALNHPARDWFWFSSDGIARFWNGANGDLIAITPDGKVGIGTTSPCLDCKVDVDGKIRSEEVVVEIVNGPDYVFEDDYDLRTLKETKEYILENKHLPEIPSAKEMEDNGVGLANMNMKLLKKIEELTLYQIEMMEEMEIMKKELQELKSK